MALKEYAVYKGENLICMGTIKECAVYMGVLPATVKFYTTATYKRRIEKRKNPRNYIVVVNLDDETQE
ncbi:hypothetical protein [Metabacillus fastidiosus]|uniref:hypothetical protein n=1 Tax=Metabacillus fastidiosus TaxID=1458 RepID=UPI003D2E0ACF